MLALWKADLKTINEKAAEALADPERYPNLFPDLEWALKVETTFLANRHNHVPARSYLEAKGDIDLDLIAIFKEQSALGIDLSAAAVSKDSNDGAGVASHGGASSPYPAPPSSTPVTARLDSHDELDAGAASAAAPPSPAKIASPVSQKPAAVAPVASPVAAPVAAPAAAQEAEDEEVDEDFDKLMAEENALLQGGSSAGATAAAAKEGDEEEFDLDDIDNAEAANAGNKDDEIDLEDEENW